MIIIFYNCKYFDQMFTYLFVTIIDNRFIKNVIKWFANVYNI